MNYYVRISGSDMNDGRSPGAAWRTIAYAAQNATIPFSTIYIGAGFYTDEAYPGYPEYVEFNELNAFTNWVGDKDGRYTGDAGDVILMAIMYTMNWDIDYELSFTDLEIMEICFNQASDYDVISRFTFNRCKFYYVEMENDYHGELYASFYNCVFRADHDNLPIEVRNEGNWTGVLTYFVVDGDFPERFDTTHMDFYNCTFAYRKFHFECNINIFHLNTINFSKARLRYHNCIFSFDEFTNPNEPMIVIDNSWDYAIDDCTDFDYNCYIATYPNHLFWIWISFFDGYYNSFEEWKTDTDNDSHSIEADPLFVGWPDLHITLYTPCRGIGLDYSSLYTVDYDWVERAFPFSLGAYEPPFVMWVRGFRVDNRMQARAAIEALQMAFFFDVIESDGKIKFIKRGKASVAAIPAEDLAAHQSGNETPQQLTITRIEDLELPKIIEVEYLDPDASYQIGVQREQRQTVVCEQKVTLILPIVLSKDEARQIAAKHMKLAWTARNAYAFAVGRKYTGLDPSDVVTVTRGGNIYLLHIDQIQNGGGIIEIQATAEDAAAYTSDAEGDALPDDGREIEWAGPTHVEYIDCPLLAETLDTPGFYLAACGFTDDWEGAALYKSIDSGSNWSAFLGTRNVGVIGYADNALAEVADANVWDDGNTLSVRLINSSDILSNGTALEVLNGANVAILGNEIIQWRTASLQDNGSYILSGLLRGRKGTEWAVSSHSAGDRFVLLNSSKIVFGQLAITEINLSRLYRAVTFGDQFEDGEDTNFTCLMRNLMPYAPTDLKAVRNDDLDLIFTWVRRTRYSAEWLDGEEDVPLGESAESYEVEIRNTPSGPILRTLEVSSPTATYTAVQQLADGFFPGDTVYYKVYQISASVDKGFVASANTSGILTP